jgi:hypothetical protein
MLIIPIVIITKNHDIFNMNPRIVSFLRDSAFNALINENVIPISIEITRQRPNRSP